MKKKKSIKQRIYKLFIIVFVSILSLLLFINIPILTLSNKTSDTDYSSWMKDTLSSEKRVVDVSMLGAHDAFSNEINIFSEIDEYSADSIMRGLTGAMIKGFIVRQSVTQLSAVDELLKSGVRYFDVRLTYDSGDWFTKHNYISGDFNLIADQITEFLLENSGEFIILDFQHIHGVDYSSLEDYEKFIEMLTDNGLLDYAYEVSNLGSLTYGELTNEKTESKIIIISKFEDSEGNILFYPDSLTSEWANSDDFDYVLDFIEEKAFDIALSSTIPTKFRVMQAVTTMQMSGGGILDSIAKWSLINRAKQFNIYLVESEYFDVYASMLPIIMVDYSNTNYKEFNDIIMNKITGFNTNP